MPTTSDSRTYPRWFLPAFALFLGVLVLAAQWIGGSLAEGLVSFAIMALLAGVLAVGGRSETVRLIRQPDERWRALDVRATAFAGVVIIGVLIVAWLWELAHGRDGNPYGLLCAISGLAYIASMAWLRFRG